MLYLVNKYFNKIIHTDYLNTKLNPRLVVIFFKVTKVVQINLKLKKKHFVNDTGCRVQQVIKSDTFKPKKNEKENENEKEIFCYHSLQRAKQKIFILKKLFCIILGSNKN